MRIEIPDHELALVRLPTVCAMTGQGKSRIYSLIQQNKFPAPVKLSARCSRWRMRDLLAWLEQQTCEK